MSGLRHFNGLDWAALLSAIALAVAATWPIWADIAHFARRDAEQSHILLAIPIALWLIWLRRERLRQCRRRGMLLGLLLIPAGIGLIMFSRQTGYQVAGHLGALVIVGGAVISVVGADAAWRFLPAVGALLFLIPIPGVIRQQIAIPLQQATASAAHFGMDLLGIPVAQAGSVLTINGVEVAVAEACNGMRMVAALALITYAFVFSVPMRPSIRILILFVSPVIAVIVNVIRLVPTVLLYGYAQESTAGLFHDLSGWLSLIIALGILWALLGLLRWIEVPLAPYTVSEE